MSRNVFVVFLALLITKEKVSHGARVLTRCYDDPPIGCFSNAYPHNNTVDRPFPIDNTSLHYVHSNGSDSLRFSWRDAKEIMKSRFKKYHKTCMIVPGWLEPLSRRWIHNLVDALTIKDLQDIGADLSTFHLIGNSLGAHVAGYIGENAPGIGRISGLDPSGRDMNTAAPEARLDPTDALVVDVIHTDGSHQLGFGTVKPLGTIDFYANGGEYQPGCAKTAIGKLLYMIFQKKGFNNCAHTRANVLFIKSINECNITASPCNNLKDAMNIKCRNCTDNSTCVRFGFNMPLNNTGLYSFVTAESPVC